MAPNALDSQLTQLEACRYRFGPHEAVRVVKLLHRLHASRFTDPTSLIRFHEALLFLRAFPQGPAVVRVTGRILNSFHKKVEALRKGGADMDDFDDELTTLYVHQTRSYCVPRLGDGPKAAELWSQGGSRVDRLLLHDLAEVR